MSSASYPPLPLVEQYCGSDQHCSINTGWTSFQDSSGNTLVTLESHLVTAHELGHNMGSAHDPDTSECSPPAEKDGKYLMYQYSVNGYERNNHFFSPCSRRSIGRAIAAKSSKCFEEEAKSFCGNNRLEDSEECDAGDEVSANCPSISLLYYLHVFLLFFRSSLPLPSFLSLFPSHTLTRITSPLPCSLVRCLLMCSHLS